ncbi:unnamed protein product [Angiostrongylus costaricensis]|uniref:MICOS complex subunit MIC60 n=1 Tax=Angiostrongylus costaricensis TaxID=334426 RepID=A0A0R3PHZ9_ANGCS|nr:unnamed protein product [Angiostrongylus costaricensis]
MNRLRRIDNQRLLCARSLRSWRDSARRPDDVLPIVDFERLVNHINLEKVFLEWLQNLPNAKYARSGRKVLLSLGSLVAVTGGVIGYAFVDPGFRLQIENTAPFTKPAFDAILGSSSLSKTKQQLTDIKEQVMSAIPKRKSEEVLPPLARIPLPEPEKKAAIHVDPVNVKAPQETGSVKQNTEVVLQKGKELESALLTAIQSAEGRVRTATEAKVKTIAAINDHSQLVKSTVDEPQTADWEKVTSALQHAESLAHKDRLAEVEGRLYIDKLRKVIIKGKSDPLTSKSPLLLNATETANKLSHELDELDGLVSKARQESAILNQYKDLIERSRNQFVLEMRSIVPNVDINAKVVFMQL